MAIHLVLLVHGVGEQTPGETVDRFLGAARGQLDLSDPVQHNTVLMVEAGTSDGEQIELYPCHIRRQRQEAGTELVLAEFHWADLSPAPRGFLATSAELLQLVLSLGYLALDNVQNNGLAPTAPVRKLIPAFVWLFYAVIAPLNAFLFLGALALLVDPFLWRLAERQGGPAKILIGLGILVGTASVLFLLRRFLARRARTYMARCIAGGLVVMAAITAVIGLVTCFVPDIGTLPYCTQDAGQAQVAGELAGIDCFVGLGVDALNAAWLAALVLLLTMALLPVKAIVSGCAKPDLGNMRSIYLSTCAAMMLSWGVFSIAFWAAFRETVTKLLGAAPNVPLVAMFDSHFGAATATLAYAALAIIVLALCGGFVALRRHRMRNSLAEDPKNPTAGDLWYGRLILNPVLNIGLFGAIFVLVCGFLYAMVEDSYGSAPGTPLVCAVQPWSLVRFACGVDAAIDATFGAWAIGSVALLGFVLVNYSAAIASALGVARDIAIYATRSRGANPRIRPGRSHYLHAKRIEARFRNTLTNLLDQTPADKITVIAHSLGSVVAVQGLQQMHGTLPAKPALVTMGCPLTHIYTQYFADNYAVPQGCTGWHNGWHNIYRCDDFVGTHVIGFGTDAANHRVRAAGHINYWTDTEVWKRLIDNGILAPLPRSRKAARRLSPAPSARQWRNARPAGRARPR